MTIREAPESDPLADMGIAATSFGGAIYGAKPGVAPASDASALAALATVAVVPGAPGAKHADTLQFLERCHALGASGVQTQMNGDLRRVRARAEELGMWMEGMVSIRYSTSEQLEGAILDCKAAGCSVARDAMLSGRRYESFNSPEEWDAWVQGSHEIIDRVLPILDKHKFTIALENHKDWTADEYAALFKKYSSEYLGACIDFGNNFSLLDDPVALIQAAAPYAKSTHIKDVALQPCPDGFEMAEVPLGSGILDLPRMISILRKANPAIRFSLEMITRDPLKISCLSDHYWKTFPERNGLYLARTLRLVDSTKRPSPLPTFQGMDAALRTRVEEDNIRACFQYKIPSPAE